jgi:hypothetical protein
LLDLATAVICASVIPLIRDDIIGNPLTALGFTWEYLNYHGLYVIGLGLWALLIAWLGYGIAKADYPEYPPLFLHPLLVLFSALVASKLEEQTDDSHEYFWYARQASYIGAVLVGYVAFWISTLLGRRAARIHLIETKEQRTLADLEGQAASRRQKFEGSEAGYYHSCKELGPFRVGEQVLMTWPDGEKEMATILDLYKTPNPDQWTVGALLEYQNGGRIDIGSADVKLDPIANNSQPQEGAAPAVE